MEKWQISLGNSVTDAGILSRRFGLDCETLQRVSEVFPFRITPYYYSLIEEKGDPLYLQCVPDIRELEFSGDLLDDPLGEEADTCAPCVVKRYPDHCLFLVSKECSMYCRFCTRKRKFRTGMCVERANIDCGLEYIRRTPEIHDVLVSGGDPFLLEDDKLEYILKGIRSIKHVEIIRIGTRTPCVLPERITRKLCSMLKKYHPLYLSLHFNHPRELTERSCAALSRLADAGIPLGSQTVLLKGVNDDPATMRTLMCALLAARVKPYYIFQCDLVYGTEHFRTPLKRGVEIIDSIRGWTSGLAVPHFGLDLPRGGGKVTLVPEYCTGRDGRVFKFRNYRGDIYEYPDVGE